MPIRRILRLLTPTEQRGAASLLGLMFIGMTLEALGVGLVVPAIALLTQHDYFARYPSLEPALRMFESHGRNASIVAGLAALITVYAIKAAFLAFLAWRESRFAFDVHAHLSQRLFTAYLRQPWTFHLQRNSALLVRNVVTDVSLVTFEGIFPAMVLVTEAMVLTGLCALLLVFEPLAALAALATLGIASWGMLRITGARSSRWGAAYEYHDGLRMQHLQQGFGGAKEVKLLGREDEFLEQYRRHNVQSARAAQMQALMQQLPRLGLEVFAVTALALVASILLWQARPADAVVPALAMFAAAAMRLIPSANRLLLAIQSLRYCGPAIETIERELKLERAASSGRSPGNPFTRALELRSVSYAYPGAASSTLEDVSLTVHRGETVGIVGPSGAGKTTLLDVLLGLLPASRGEVLVDGRDITHVVRRWQDQIGYVPQSTFLTDDTLRRNVAFGLPDYQIDERAVQRAIQAAQLQGFVETLPAKLDTLVGERGVRLSGGQRQRIGIARALYHDPALLVLDEATSSLDLSTEREVMEAIAALQESKTIIIVSHRTSTVERCQRVYRLQGRRVIETDRSAMRSGAV